jgi:hypothetical protein
LSAGAVDAAHRKPAPCRTGHRGRATAHQYRIVARDLFPPAVRAAQQFLQGQGLYLRDDRNKPLKPDGIWGPGMSRAIEQYLERNRADQESFRARLKKEGEDRERETGTLRGLERDERTRRLNREVPRAGSLRFNLSGLNRSAFSMAVSRSA